MYVCEYVSVYFDVCVLMCFCMCVCWYRSLSVWVCVDVCLWVWVCTVHLDFRGKSWELVPAFSLVWDRFPLVLCYVCQASWPKSLLQSSLFCFLSPSIRLLCGLWDPNSDYWAWVSSTLPTEPFLHLKYTCLLMSEAGVLFTKWNLYPEKICFPRAVFPPFGNVILEVIAWQSPPVCRQVTPASRLCPNPYHPLNTVPPRPN